MGEWTCFVYFRFWFVANLKKSEFETSKMCWIIVLKMFSQHLNVASWCLHGGPFVDFPNIRFWDSEITALYVFSDVPKCCVMQSYAFLGFVDFTKRYHFWRTLTTLFVFLAFPNVVLLRVSWFLGVSKCCVIKVLDYAFFWCLRNLAFSGFLKACISENTPSVKKQAHAMSSETPSVGGAKGQQICWGSCTPSHYFRGQRERG